MDIPTPSEEQISAVATYLTAQTYESLVRGLIEPIQNEVIDALSPHIAKHDVCDQGAGPVSWKELYLASDDDAARCFELKNELIASRYPSILPSDKKFCPLLIAESLTRDAAYALVSVFEGYLPGIRVSHDLLRGKVTQRQEYVRLITSLVIAYAKESDISLPVNSFNGYTISFNPMWNEFQVDHPDIGANVEQFSGLPEAIEFCEKG